ncbi:MAG: hypothetical protein IPN88_08945 [Bacteroidetes bacterium]|nr:hypothetical protein [Bacteroidota bacterium]
MNKDLTSSIGRLRLLGFLEGTSLSSFIPFGTFYIDNKILRPIHVSK